MHTRNALTLILVRLRSVSELDTCLIASCAGMGWHEPEKAIGFALFSQISSPSLFVCLFACLIACLAAYLRKENLSHTTPRLYRAISPSI